MSRAHLWRDQNKRVEAGDLLVPVYGWFAEGFGTPVLQDGKALLEELEALGMYGLAGVVVSDDNARRPEFSACANPPRRR